VPKICYTKKKFNAAQTAIIDKANAIIEDMAKQGFTLTLRQLYYQFISEAFFPNTEKSYKMLGNIISDARLAGLVDWEAIIDRTRRVREKSHWSTPADVINAAYRSYAIDMWQRQSYRPEVWIEKDALVGVFEGICRELDVPLFSCKGYTSQSEMWVGAMRLLDHKVNRKQTPVILHFGDHDPSGRDMTRDIQERLELFTRGDMRLHRLALNIDQIKKYNPPPNPAKVTDPRADAYIAEFGQVSWELDALKPQVIAQLVRTNVTKFMNKKIWKEDLEREATEKNQLRKASKYWDRIAEQLDDTDDDGTDGEGKGRAASDGAGEEE
jgi:hypothetical protein